MSNLFYTQAPQNIAHGGHEPWSNITVESFPDLHAHGTFEQRRDEIRQQLSHQLLTAKADDLRTKVLLRECFKLNNRELIEYCINEKVPNTSFVQAAKLLGYRKV